MRRSTDAFVPTSWVNRRTSAEFGDVVAVADEEVEGAAGLDRGQLCPVADEDDFRAGTAGLSDEGVEGERAGQRCFVDDDQLTRPQ